MYTSANIMYIAIYSTMGGREEVYGGGNYVGLEEHM